MRTRRNTVRTLLSLPKMMMPRSSMNSHMTDTKTTVVVAGNRRGQRAGCKNDGQSDGMGAREGGDGEIVTSKISAISPVAEVDPG